MWTCTGRYTIHAGCAPMQTPNVTPSASQVRLDLRNALTNQSMRLLRDRRLERAAERVERNLVSRRDLGHGERAAAASIDAEGVEDGERGWIACNDVVDGGARVDSGRDGGD